MPQEEVGLRLQMAEGHLWVLGIKFCSSLSSIHNHLDFSSLGNYLYLMNLFYYFLHADAEGMPKLMRRVT